MKYGDLNFAFDKSAEIAKYMINIQKIPYLKEITSDAKGLGIVKDVMKKASGMPEIREVFVKTGEVGHISDVVMPLNLLMQQGELPVEELNENDFEKSGGSESESEASEIFGGMQTESEAEDLTAAYNAERNPEEYQKLKINEVRGQLSKGPWYEKYVRREGV